MLPVFIVSLRVNDLYTLDIAAFSVENVNLKENVLSSLSHPV